MKKLFIISFACCFISCSDHSGSKAESKEAAKKQDIFPVTSFLAGQVHEVDSLNPPLVKYITVDNKTDTIPISKEEFKMLANEFMQPDITDSSLRGFYKETSFADQSIPSVTLTYSTTAKNLEVQRVDVVIQPDPVVNDKVQSVYMEKLTRKNDTSVLKKLIWQVDKNFHIIISTQVGNNPETVSQLKVSWYNED